MVKKMTKCKFYKEKFEIRVVENHSITTRNYAVAYCQTIEEVP